MALNPALRQRMARAQAGIKKDAVIRDGQYAMLIKSMAIIDASLTGVGDMFAATLRVEQAVGVTPGVEPNQVGSDCASKCNLSTNRSAMGNVKSMVAGALGIVDPNAIPESEWDRILDWVFSDAQPMRGMLIAGLTFRTTIQKGANAGQPFVGVNWSQIINGNSPAEIAQRRAMLDSADAMKPVAAPPQPFNAQYVGAPSASQGAPPQYAPQGAPPQYAPQGAPPQYGAPQGAPPQYAPQGAPPAQFAPPAQQYAPPVQSQFAPPTQQTQIGQQGQPPQGWQGR